uniref:Transferrin-like protein IDI-100 n=1 Tax=Dunaliella salina TaxID=3046 RepID=Q8H1B6_DUNSA|nr:transferrin-like protein IDI-100 [Dunaliella salina]
MPTRRSGSVLGLSIWLASMCTLIASVAADTVRICVPFDDNDLTDQCTTNMQAGYGTTDVSFECTKGGSAEACMRRIATGVDHISVLGGNDLYLSHKDYRLTTFISQSIDGGTTTAVYYGLAVVKAETCTSGTIASFKDLRGKKACHTGYRRTVGWQLPIGKLLATGVMPEVADPDGEVSKDIASHRAFFGDSCVPGARDRDGNTLASNTKLCELCQTPTGDATCEFSDEVNDYASYTGAFKCMDQGDGQVAFVKETTLDDYNAELAEASAGQVQKGDFRILCDDKCVEWDGYLTDESCSTGKRPTSALIGRKDFPSTSLGVAAIDLLYNNGAVKPEAQLQGGRQSFFWSANNVEDGEPAVSLQKVEDYEFRNHFTAYEQYKHIEESEYQELENPDVTVKVCVPYDEDQAVEECSRIMDLEYSGTFGAGLTTKFQCSNGGSRDNCMKRIAEGQDDLSIFIGDDLYLAHRNYDLTAYIAQSFDGESTAVYTGLAVVKREKCECSGTDCIKKFGDLAATGEGTKKNACHMRYRRTDGWRLPVGKLLALGIMPELMDPSGKLNVDAYSQKEFFGDVCVPGAEDRNGEPAAEMCELCRAPEGAEDKCATRGDGYVYSGRVGAFQCMDEGAGDVAFVSESMLDGYNEELRSQNKQEVSKDDYRILCDDRCAPWDTYKTDPTCTTGHASTPAVVARKDFGTTAKGKAAIESLYNHGGVKPQASGIGGLRGRNGFFWAGRTTRLVLVPNPSSDAGFKEFFKSYDQYDHIAETEDADNAATTKQSTIRMRLSAVQLTSNDIDARNFAYENFVERFQARLRARLSDRCRENANSGCGKTIFINVLDVAFVSASRRRLLAATIDVQARVEGADAQLADGVAQGEQLDGVGRVERSTSQWQVGVTEGSSDDGSGGSPRWQ